MTKCLRNHSRDEEFLEHQQAESEDDQHGDQGRGPGQAAQGQFEADGESPQQLQLVQRNHAPLQYAVGKMPTVLDKVFVVVEDAQVQKETERSSHIPSATARRTSSVGRDREGHERGTDWRNRS